MFKLISRIWAIFLILLLSEIFDLIESFMSALPIFKYFISLLLWSLIVFVFVYIILFLRKSYIEYRNTTLEQLKKIKQLAQDYVKDFIEQGKSEFTHDDLKDFTVIVKFKNGITIPKLERYSYKEHALLLDILEETYNQLINNFEFKEWQKRYY